MSPSPLTSIYLSWSLKAAYDLQNSSWIFTVSRYLQFVNIVVHPVLIFAQLLCETISCRYAWICISRYAWKAVTGLQLLAFSKWPRKLVQTISATKSAVKRLWPSISMTGTSAGEVISTNILLSWIFHWCVGVLRRCFVRSRRSIFFGCRRSASRDKHFHSRCT